VISYLIDVVPLLSRPSTIIHIKRGTWREPVTYFQNKYVKPQYINSNNKVHQLFQLEENKHLMSPRVPLICT